METEEFDTDVFGIQSPDPPPLPTHCDIPLKFNKQRAALGIPSQGQYIPKNNHLKKELQDIFKVTGVLTFHRLELSQIQLHLLNLNLIPTNPVIQTEWKQQHRVSNFLWNLNLKSVHSCSSLPTDNPVVTLTTEEQLYLFSSYKIKSFWEEAVLLSGSGNYKPKHWWTRVGKKNGVARLGRMLFVVTSNLIAIKSEQGNFLASRDHLLILSDLASQRYLLRLLSVCEIKKQRQDFFTPEQLDYFLQIGDRVLQTSGNAGYKYIYTLEPACVSRLTGDIPVGTPNSLTFRENIYKSTTMIADDLSIEDLHEERETFLNSLSDDPQLLAQAFGLYRIWGHPTVEPLEGTSALKEVATKVRGLNAKYSNAITYKFKEEFIMRYIRQEKKWPPLDVTQLSPTNPVRESYEHKTDFPIHHQNYKRSYLRLIKFLPTFPVDPKFDLVEMIADKAMSLFTPDLINHLIQGKGVGTSLDRSVLVQWLQSALHDPVEFLKTVDLYGFTHLEKTLGVKEKEREGKIEARLFGLMTLIKRMYIVLTEALLAEYLIKYFPEITMIDDELSLDKKRLMFNDPSLYNRSVFTSLDFSKWNSNMREAETHGIFQAFDQLFGFTNCFQRTHEMFKDSYIYLLNGSYLPTYRGGHFISDLGSWYGHLGGIEGLRQKGWTLWTISLILLAAENYPIRLKLMGQGDNQILREIFPQELTPDRQLELHFQFLQQLNLILEHIGPPLKMEETWTSREFFVYGKYLMYKGAALPMYAKRICRMFRLSNEDYPTLESTISSLTANLSSALSYSTDPGYLLYIYYTELIGIFQLYLTNAYLHKQSIQEKISRSTTLRIPGRPKPQYLSCPPFLKNTPIHPDLTYIKLSLLPRCLGGYPVTNFFMSTLRGFPDEVTFSISTLKLFYVHSPPEIQKFIVSILNPPLHNEQNFTLLLEHPTSLNLNVPPTPSEARRNSVIKFLQGSKIVKNPYLKTFLQLLNSPFEEMLIEYLSTASPFNPRILSQISSATVEARARHIANKLQKTKTISALARKEKLVDIYKIIEACETNHTISVFRLITSIQPNSFNWHINKCSVTHAQELRDTGWKRHIEGVDCVPPQEFLYLESLNVQEKCHSIFDLPKGYIIIRFSSSMTKHQFQDPLTVGHFKPYRGSTTKQKVSGFGEKLSIISEPLLQKVIKSFNLIGWGIASQGNLSSLLHQLLEARTDLDPKWLIPDESQLAGSVHHRLQDDRTGHGGSVSLLPNYASKFTFDTFPLYEYSKGSKNVNLMFQSLMSYSVVLVSWALSTGWSPPIPSIHLHVKNSCCVREINETLIDCTDPPPPCIISHKESPYLYTPAELYLNKHLKELLLKSDAPPSSDPETLQRRFIAAMSEEVLELIQPYTWDIPKVELVKKSLVINWCLNAPLIPILELLCLRLCVFYIDAIRHSTPDQFLIRVYERVSRSPSFYWSQLSNFIFYQNFHHDLVAAPYYVHLSGNPCLSDEGCGNILKTACQQILLVWASDNDVKRSLYQLEVLCTQNVGLHQHPAVLLATRDWLTAKSDFNLKDLKYEIVKTITKVNIKEQGPLTTLAIKYLQASRGTIFKESTDFLSKKCFPIAPAVRFTTPSSLTNLPNTSITLFTVSQGQLIHSEVMVFPVAQSFHNSYITHLFRSISLPTSGMYKALSVINHLKLQLNNHYLCLGDGSGGYSWAVLRTNPYCTVFYNSLITSESSIQQAPPIPYIPALAGYPDFEDRIDSLHLTNDGISDLLHPCYADYLKFHLTKNYEGLFCDAESKDYLLGTFAFDLMVSLVKISKNLNIKWAVVKSYALNPSALRAQLSILLSYFQQVQIVRSDFSASGNTEIFLYCLKLEAKVMKCDMLQSNKLGGYVLPDSILPVLEELKITLLQGASFSTEDSLIQYTTILNEGNWESLDKSILSTVPMIAEQVDLVYPHSVLTWMRTSGQLHPGMPKIIITHLETKYFTKDIIKHWSMCWLLLGCWSEALDHEHIWTIISSGVCIWYLLKDNTWEISLSLDVPPLELQGPSLLVWELGDLIGSKELKIFHRTLSILYTYAHKPKIMSSGLERGNLNVFGHPVGPNKEPKNLWVMKHIFKPMETPIAYPSIESKGLVKSIWEQRMKRRRKFF
ncbi:RNA-dependent RNA polymerase [Wuhan Ant Virus]|uniref:RNA-dependent RNA polymerase n=1 Tax=Wuhan Ant Virus TaxID=1608100 RepID=UPI0005AD4BCC|nr:RNA-dependent RNA polymerase [Wuhan Ant Virus]AJG39155.1 RNA-dependent RNA polymerase [Wuhan Ant Virus]